MCVGKSQNLQMHYAKNVITIWKMVISPRKSCFMCLKLTYTFAFFLSSLLVTFSHLCTLLALWNKPLVWKRAVKHNTELYKTEKIGILSHYMGSNFRCITHSVVASETDFKLCHHYSLTSHMPFSGCNTFIFFFFNAMAFIQWHSCWTLMGMTAFSNAKSIQGI